eukprot:m.77298 g.77298  ORF g.77298 m.77298 type:complete len:217 (+) comp14541_c0_seq1:2236-2886(+)
MLHNPVPVNLLLSGIVSRLAQYPLPILRDFLLDPQQLPAPDQASLFLTLRGIAEEACDAESTVQDFPKTLDSTRKSLDPQRAQPSLDKESAATTASKDPARMSSPKLLRKVVASLKRRGSDPELPRGKGDSTEAAHTVAASPVAPADPFGDVMAQAEAQSKSPTQSSGAEGKKKVGQARLKRMALGVLIFEELLKELAALSLEQGLRRIGELGTDH